MTVSLDDQCFSTYIRLIHHCLTGDDSSVHQVLYVQRCIKCANN